LIVALVGTLVVAFQSAAVQPGHRVLCLLFRGELNQTPRLPLRASRPLLVLVLVLILMLVLVLVLILVLVVVVVVVVVLILVLLLLLLLVLLVAITAPVLTPDWLG